MGEHVFFSELKHETYVYFLALYVWKGGFHERHNVRGEETLYATYFSAFIGGGGRQDYPGNQTFLKIWGLIPYP